MKIFTDEHPSPAGALNTVDLKRIGWGLICVVVSAGLTYLTNNAASVIADVNLTYLSPVIMVILTPLLDALGKYFSGSTSK